jgi:hypothetical protein
VWRRQPPDPGFADVVEVLNGIGRMLMEIDAKLRRVVQLLEKEYGDGEDA